MNLLKLLILLLFILQGALNISAQEKNQLDVKNLYPWCIVAYDSLERSPADRITMISELGFKKYAYDWRDKHLDQSLEELLLAERDSIEIIAIWLWTNAKRDQVGKLSPSNQKIMEIVEQAKLNTTFWVSMSGNYFKGIDEEGSLSKAIDMINYIAKSAEKIGCKVALYNHSGWFADPYSQLKIIDSLNAHDLKMVYNFHHAHSSIDSFEAVSKSIAPYLLAVNLNGMEKNGRKILGIGKGEYESEMIRILLENGFNGPWGIMGHVEGVDVRKILEQNIQGLNELSDEINTWD